MIYQKNVKRGLQTKNNNGWRPGQAPEGYLNDFSEEKGNRKIITDPDRSPLIRKMWDLLLTENYTVPKILKIVNEDWKYKMRMHKKRGGTPMTRSGLYSIFTNPFYYGWYEYSGEWYEGKHKRIITQAEYDKAQAILGRRGKQRPKTHEFAFTGMVRCGECSAMVTAEEKINRYGYRYIYYHCTKRVNPKCTQKSIEVADLEKQIDYMLTKIEIPESFKDWAIEYLNELHDKETENQLLINKSVDESYAGCIKKINNLIAMKISDQNTDGSLSEFIDEQLASLLKEKKNLMEKKSNVDERVEKWLELSTKTFNFACYARMRFAKGSLAEQKEILQAIGSNFIFEDKTLRLQVPKPFVLVEDAKNEIDEIRAMLEPHEKIDLTAQMMQLFAQNPVLRREQDSNLR